MEQRFHAILGGSSAARWSNCHGSVSYLKNLPKQLETDAMKKGTIAHKVAEAVLGERLRYAQFGIDADVPTYYDKTIAEAYALADFYKMDVTDEMFDDAEEYAEAIWEKVLEGFITNKWYKLEQYFHFDEQLCAGGSVDGCFVWTDDRGRVASAVADYKNGYTEVPVKDNAQLAFYACSLRKYCRSQNIEIEYCKGVIYQPHGQSGKVYKDTIFTGKQLDKWERKFTKAAHEIYIAKSQKLKTGSWCTWCAAKPVCTKYVKDRSSETSLQLIDPAALKFPMPEMVPLDTLVKINEHAADIKKYLTACHEYLKSLTLNGQGPAHLKVVESTGKRKWGSQVAHIKQSLEELGLTGVVTEKLKGITDISRALKKLIGVQKTEELLTNCTTRYASKLILVDAEDERPPAVNNTALMLAPDEIDMESEE